MNHMLIALAIGIVAGLIDVIPMIAQKMDRSSNFSAFFHWVALGLIIPFVSWDFPGWITGLIIGELTAIPILLIVATKDKGAILPILVMSAILGTGIGMVGQWLIR